MTIYITVEGPVYITMHPGDLPSPLGGTIGPAKLKEVPTVALEATLDNEQYVTLAINPTTQAGNPGQMDGDPVWTLEAGTCTLKDLDPPDPKRRDAYADPVAVGDVVVHCTADVDLGEGTKHMVQVFILHVESPEIASMGGSISEPQLKPMA